MKLLTRLVIAQLLLGALLKVLLPDPAALEAALAYTTFPSLASPSRSVSTSGPERFPGS
jgi:hypothetical protein